MEKRIIEVEERLPLLPTIPLSLQHLFAMFGSTVLVPFLLHVDPATCLFMNGVGTLLYLFICKWKLPAYLGSSFAFISPVLAVTATDGMTYADAQSGFICFGLSFMILALLVKKIGTSWIDVLFPPAAMGSIVAIIGLELAPLAMSMSGFSGEAQGMTNAMAVMISMFTLIVTILATVLGRGFISIIPILIGVIAGYILSIIMGVVDFSNVAAKEWFAFPTFYSPRFNFSAVMMIMPALFVVFAEHLGHLFVTSDIVGRDLIKDPGLHRSLFADGLSNMISGFAGSTPNTTYGEIGRHGHDRRIQHLGHRRRGSLRHHLFLHRQSGRCHPCPSPLPLWAACAFSSSVSSHPQGSACSSKRKWTTRNQET